MTIDIDAIRQREQAADSGPWRVVEEHGRDIADEAYTRLTVQTPIHYGESREIAEMVDPDHDWASKLPEENAEFIAHARTDIPALLAELDRVRADLAAAHNHAHRQDTNLQQIARAKDELAAERDALKQQLAEILAMAERFDTPRDSSRVRVFLGDLKHLAYKAITEHKVAVAR